jgi:hypothetical protein
LVAKAFRPTSSRDLQPGNGLRPLGEPGFFG